MFSGDENTFSFVKNQLMRMLGVKRIKKKRDKRKVTMVKTTTEYHRSTVKTRKDSLRVSTNSHRSPSPDLDEDLSNVM